MRFADNNGTRIYWEEHGEGEPLLLIMGLGYSSEMWHRTTPVLSRHYRTILFDNRGVGRSDCPEGPYTMPEMARDAAAVVEAVGCERVHVFGVSMGGMIAQEFALAYPKRTISLILGCTAAGGPEAVPAEAEVTATLSARGYMSPEEGIQAMVPYIYDESTPRERIDEDLEIRRRTFPKPESYFAQIAGIMMFEAYSRLPRLSAPTLVIHGENDRLVPCANGKLIADRIPGARFVPIKNASHIFITDQERQSHEAILGFLSEIPQFAPSGVGRSDASSDGFLQEAPKRKTEGTEEN
jgi:pimeloyl-ACP methyl ester carboxylesterase